MIKSYYFYTVFIGLFTFILSDIEKVDKLKQRIKDEEGLRLNAYYDTQNLLTIGYGHLVTSDDTYDKNSIITNSEADNLFDKDFNSHLNELINHCNKLGIDFNKLPIGSQHSLTDMMFNLGGRLFKFNNLFENLKNKKYIEASKEILDSKYGRDIHSGWRAKLSAFTMLSNIISDKSSNNLDIDSKKKLAENIDYCYDDIVRCYQNYQVNEMGCSSGSYLSIEGKCVLCGKGTYSNDGKLCYSCNKNFYQDQEGQTQCNECPNGTYSEKESSKCQPCEKGSFGIGRGLGCNYCPVNYYQDELAQIECKICPNGTYGDAPNGYGGQRAKSCAPCSKGTFGAGVGKGCDYCPVNYYQDQEGQLECKVCPNGTYGDAPNGYGGQRSQSCAPCSKGTFGTGVGKGCDYCPVNYYQDQEGQLECKVCPNATYGNAPNGYGGKAAKSCAPCQKGTYAAGIGKGCDYCPLNYYQDEEGQSNCKICPIGTYGDAPNGYGGQRSQSCAPCPKGTYDEGMGKGCSNCSENYYQDQVGQLECKACPNGSFGDAPLGYGGRRSSKCSLCPKGMYGDGVGKGCNNCSENFYQDQEGQLSCKPCPKGTRGDSPNGYGGRRASKCVACSKGTFGTKDGEGCTNCPNNYYQDREGQYECIPCPDGTYGDAPIGYGGQKSSKCAPCINETTGAGIGKGCKPIKNLTYLN